jgi:hypothetical protein
MNLCARENYILDGGSLERLRFLSAVSGLTFYYCVRYGERREKVGGDEVSCGRLIGRENGLRIKFDYRN